MDDVKIKVIDSDKLIDAINKGSYEINLSAVMAFGTLTLDAKKQENCEYCREELLVKKRYGETKINYCPMCGRKLQWT